MQYPTFQKNTPLAAADLNELVDFIRRARVLPGVGIKLTETLNGTVISLKPTRGSSHSDTPARPWDIVEMVGVGPPGSAGNASSYEARIWPGSANGVAPDNLFDFDGTLKKWAFPSSLTHWKCKCSTDGKKITTATIVVDSSPPPLPELVPQAIPAEFWFTFALTYEGKIYRTIGASNPLIHFTHIITDKTEPPLPGLPGIDRWYIPSFS